MPAYVIATTRGVNDRRALEEYWSRAGVTLFEGTGAKPLAIYTPTLRKSGKTPCQRPLGRFCFTHDLPWIPGQRIATRPD
jgi:hypothetical protein